MKFIKWTTLAIIFIAALAACSSATTPPLAQLATACESASAAYNTAAAYRVQGKLSTAAYTTLHDLEPAVLAACNPAAPPADPATALQTVTAMLNQWALINAGVTPATTGGK